jgi:hypothetical protein
VSTASPVVETKTVAKNDDEADFFNQKAPEDKKLDLASILKLYDNAVPPTMTQSNSLFGSQQATAQQPSGDHFDGLSLFGNSGSGLNGSNGSVSAPSAFNQSNTALLAQPLTSPFSVQSTVSSNNQAPNNLIQTTNPFLANNTSNAFTSQPQMGGQQLHQQFGGMQLNQQQPANNWMQQPIQQTPQSAFAAFDTGLAQPAHNFANPFAAGPAPPLIAAGVPNPGSAFAAFQPTVAAAVPSSLDTLNWGFTSTPAAPLAPTPANLWQ